MRSAEVSCCFFATSAASESVTQIVMHGLNAERADGRLKASLKKTLNEWGWKAMRCMRIQSGKETPTSPLGLIRARIFGRIYFVDRRGSGCIRSAAGEMRAGEEDEKNLGERFDDLLRDVSGPTSPHALRELVHELRGRCLSIHREIREEQAGQRGPTFSP